MRRAAALAHRLMTTLQALFDDGVAAHRAGRLAEARIAYEAILARDPDHFDARHMLGVAAVQVVIGWLAGRDLTVPQPVSLPGQVRAG